MTQKASVVQCADNGWDEFTVDVILEDGEVEADSHFQGKNAKAKAEKRAAAVAKMWNVDWETNY